MRLKSKLLFFLQLIVVLFAAARAQAADIAVVVNETNSVSSVTTTELRKMFTGDKHTWPGGQAVKLFVRASGTAERSAILSLLGMSEGDYKKHWSAQVFRGDAQAEPVTLPSNGMQLEAVRAFPGAIILISAQDVHPGVKVLKVDGKLPGDAGYPLH